MVNSKLLLNLKLLKIMLRNSDDWINGDKFNTVFTMLTL